eukprot:2248562-Amphidinium_carterae.1
MDLRLWPTVNFRIQTDSARETRTLVDLTGAAWAQLKKECPGGMAKTFMAAAREVAMLVSILATGQASCSPCPTSFEGRSEAIA